MNQPGQKSKRAYRPPPRLILTTWEHLLAFWFGAGLSPVAPGTAGTLAALPLWFLLRPLPLVIYLPVVAALFVFGCWVCGVSAKRLGVHDHGGIVFDEVVGLLVSCVPLLPALGLATGGWQRQLGWVTVAFLLFRLFDVWKPWPIRLLDRRVEGGFGIMIDDLIAALYAAAVLAAVVFHGKW
jgi:phosphatidylglycerophosphatase A